VSVESDENLMRRVQQGDAAAFDALLSRHGRSIRSRLAAIVRDGDWADDLAQEVFLRLWTRSKQWTGQGSVAGWLMRIATNLALNHLRSRRRRRDLPAAPPADENGPPGEGDWMEDESAPDPAELLERAEQLEMFRQSMEALPEAKRAVIRMIHEEDMDIAEVAERLGIPKGTVKSRLHYAIRRLADELGGVG